MTVHVLHKHCTATTAKGEPCRNTAVNPETGLCIAHETQAGLREKPKGFGGAQPNSGPKPKPRPREVLERFIAEEVERLGQAYFGVLLEGMRSKDEQVRIRAAVELGNRLWGRPAQAVELSGAVEQLAPAGRLAVESESVRRLADAVRDELMARDTRPVRSSG